VQAFDDLLLMKVGGHIIYHGPLGTNSIKLVEYFEVTPHARPRAPPQQYHTWGTPAFSLLPCYPHPHPSLQEVTAMFW